MTAPLPAWIPAAPGPAAGDALHLRFAIIPVGPSLPHLAGGADLLMSSPQGSAWHELTLAALLVCLAVDKAELGAHPEASSLAGTDDVALLAAEMPRPGAPCDEGMPSGPNPPSVPGLDEEWMKLLLGRSGLDAAWMLA